MRWALLALAAVGPFVVVYRTHQKPELAPFKPDATTPSLAAQARPQGLSASDAAEIDPASYSLADLPEEEELAGEAVVINAAVALAARQAAAEEVPEDLGDLSRYDQAILDDPEESRFWLYRGMERWRRGQKAEAVADVTEALRRAKRLTIPLIEGLIAGWMTGRASADDPEDYYRDDLELNGSELDAEMLGNPSYAWPRLLRSKIAFDAGDDDRARADFARYQALAWASWTLRRLEERENAVVAAANPVGEGDLTQ